MRRYEQEPSAFAAQPPRPLLRPRETRGGAAAESSRLRASRLCDATAAIGEQTRVSAPLRAAGCFNCCCCYDNDGSFVRRRGCGSMARGAILARDVSRRVTWRRCEVKRSATARAYCAQAFRCSLFACAVKIENLACQCLRSSRPIGRAQHGTAIFSTHVVLYCALVPNDLLDQIA